MVRFNNPNAGVFDDDYDLSQVTDERLKERLEFLRRHDIGLKQLVTELTPLYAFLRERKPFHTLVELGCWQGATAWLLSEFLQPGARIILIDMLRNVNDFKKASFVTSQLSKAGFKATLMRETTREAFDQLRGLDVDYLHIDADHRYEGARWDFDHYSELTAAEKDAVIQLHDIAMTGWSNPKHQFGVHKLWAELKALPATEGRMVEFIDRTYADPQPRVEGHVGTGLILR